jgi:hypothetical protein
MYEILVTYHDAHYLIFELNSCQNYFIKLESKFTKFVGYFNIIFLSLSSQRQVDATNNLS